MVGNRPRVEQLGIAGWPLRNASEEEFERLLFTCAPAFLEIPKDLVRHVSIKRLGELARRFDGPICFAGTTDFADAGGMDWSNYSRYLDIQLAMAAFLRCKMMRCFLGASSTTGFTRALDRVQEFARRANGIEIVIETHGGFESRMPGFEQLLTYTRVRLVMDWANLEDDDVRASVLRGQIGERIAYFHLRYLPGTVEGGTLGDAERRLIEAYPRHVFLWEPKEISGADAIDSFSANRRRSAS